MKSSVDYQDASQLVDSILAPYASFGKEDLPTGEKPMSAAAGPFAGILVADLTRVLAGPFCTMTLADLGARVIKMERPRGGDDARGFGPFQDGQSLYFSFVNRGKESIALDLKKPADRELFLNIVRRADVLVENYRPGTMEKLGLGWDRLSAVNPRLVFASVSGFGASGPLSRAPAYDTVVQAFSGLMSVTGFADGPATRVGTSISDLTAGLYCFAGIAAALHNRTRTGRGTRIDVAMFDGLLAMLEHSIMEYVACGRAAPRRGNKHPTITPFDTFAAADQSFVLCVGNDDLFARTCAAIGRADLVADARFGTNELRWQNEPALKAALEATFASKPARAWLECLQEAGIPCSPINSIPDAVDHPHTQARNMMIEAGGVRMPGCPIKMSGFADPPSRPAAPALDANGASIRQEFGC
jgi:CoA:oxalate CoA-transferase